jgi:Rod binding domain-containing protein
MTSPALSAAASISPEFATPITPFSKGAKAAREFEAQLIGSLLESYEKTFASLPGDSQVPGSDNYNYLGTQALGSALAASGGFGIAAMITRSFAKHEGNG